MQRIAHFALVLFFSHFLPQFSNCQNHLKTDFDLLGNLDKYNVVWNSPSINSKGSMPIGNGDIGLNVWVEKDGDLLFYIGKSDAWSETPSNSEGLIKVGKIRLHIDNNPFKEGNAFLQTLDLKNGIIHIKANNNLLIDLWVDANKPIVHVDINSTRAENIRLQAEPMRTDSTKAWKLPYLVSKLNNDIILENKKDKIAWLYANQNTKVKQLTNLKFGAIAEGTGLVSNSSTSLISSTPQKNCSISVVVYSSNDATPAIWYEHALKKTSTLSLLASDRKAHETWWKSFWNRSWVFIEGDKDAETVTRAYILQRYVSACAGRGAYAIKFNGSLFTMDDTLTVSNKDKTKSLQPVNADFRSWGGSYWMQNTRHMYWPMLQSGDVDLLMPFFTMYLNMVPANKEAVKQMYNANGVVFAETSPFWGLVSDAKDESKGGYVQHYYTQSLELLAMMLDYVSMYGDRNFAQTKMLPLAEDALRFFVERFKKDDTGKLVFQPDNSMETYWKARNPSTDIAGFRYVIENLLELPKDFITAEQRKTWEDYLKIAPILPLGTKNGKEVILAAEKTDSIRHNTENPELYTIFPFRMFGLDKPKLDLAKNTFKERHIKTVGCWHHDVLSAALLGETVDAKNELVRICSLKNAKDNKDNGFRFPAFWGPGHDYSPDEDHGGVLQNALQLMLLQTVGHNALVLPAFPKNWNVNYKLHTNGESTVWVDWKDGKMRFSKIESKTNQQIKLPE